jgi:hypothetical protein
MSDTINVWGNGITVQGCALSPWEMDKAFAKWSPYSGLRGLARAIAETQPLFAQVDPDVPCRAADRMMQIARKADMIRVRKFRVWEYVIA